MKWGVNAVLFLFIFNLFNREFTVFVDLRIFICLFEVVFLLLKATQVAFNRNLLLATSKINLFIYFVLIIAVCISNITWLNSPLIMDKDTFFNLIILYIYNLMSVAFFTLFFKELSLNIFLKSVHFSAFFLLLSMIAALCGIDIYFFSNEDVRAVHEGAVLSPFGVRVAGYSEDANYATLCMMIWGYTSYALPGIKRTKLLVLFCAILGVLLSFSKTVILGLVVSYVFYFLIVSRAIYFVFPAVFGLIVISIPFILDLMSLLQTMSTRFVMWSVAFEAFLNNPIFGWGISAVRSNFLFQGYWYVQPHNTFLAIAVDHGIIVLSIFVYLLVHRFKEDNASYRLLLSVLIFLMCTSDLLPFPYIVFIIVLLPIMLKTDVGNNKNVMRLRI